MKGVPSGVPHDRSFSLLHANWRIPALLLLSLVLAFLAAWAITIGAVRMPFSEVAEALLSYDGSRDHLIVTTVRLPRIVTGMMVGAALAVAGAIMQAVTGNPLASPGILGINAGAAFAVVIAIVVLGTPSRDTYVWFAFLGAAAAAVTVYMVASGGADGATPVKLALSGSIFATFLSALTTAILIFDAQTLGAIRHWTAGSLAVPELGAVIVIAPYALAGLAMALLMSGQVTTLSLGPDVARSLGQNLPLWRALAGLCVVLLAGSSVALAGPIGFVGLVVPHIVRLSVGVDYRWIMPFCALGGALLVVAADAVLRVIFPDNNVPVGVTMAMIGAPFFIYLARNKVGRGI